MARSDLIVALVQASVAGDKAAARTAIEAMIAEESGKQHKVLAERLQRVLNTPVANSRVQTPISEQNARARDVLAEVSPRRQLDDLVLSESNRELLNQVIEEQERVSLLQSFGLDPRNRILLIGPPGNGKTSLAEAIADSLSVPFFVVRYEALVGSYLGETATRLRRVFDYVKTTPCVLFFDEFDAIGKERGDTHETGEIKRVVSSLLMHVDDLPSYVVVVAASNHPELLDRAVWRRFQVRLDLPPPSPSQISKFVERHLSEIDEKTGVSATSIANRLGATSFAEVEEFILGVKRRYVLGMQATPLRKILQEQLMFWAKRSKVVAKSGKRT